MKKTSKFLALMLMLVMAISLMCVSVFANSAICGGTLATTPVGDSTVAAKFQAFVESNNYELGKYASDFVETATSSDPIFYVSIEKPNASQIIETKTYYYKGSETEFINNFAKDLKGSAGNAKDAIEKTENVFKSQDIDPDLNGAMAALEGFRNIINIFLGIVVIAITMLLAMYTAFDVCYIAFPVFRNKCEEAKVNGGPGTKRGSNGETKLRFVSDEAQFAVADAEKSETGKSPLMTYLSKRIVAYILVAIILFILLTGNINIITSLALRIVSFIIDAIAKL